MQRTHLHLSHTEAIFLPLLPHMQVPSDLPANTFLEHMKAGTDLGTDAPWSAAVPRAITARFSLLREGVPPKRLPRYEKGQHLRKVDLRLWTQVRPYELLGGVLVLCYLGKWGWGGIRLPPKQLPRHQKGQHLRKVDLRLWTQVLYTQSAEGGRAVLSKSVHRQQLPVQPHSCTAA